MVSARTKSDEIVLVSDVFLLGVVQWVVVSDVVLDAAVFLVRWAIDCQQLLRRVEDGGLVLVSARTLFVVTAPFPSAGPYHKS